MALSQNTRSALGELRQIQTEAREAATLEALRSCFDRVQAVRHAHPDDFDTQLLVAEVQDEIIAFARNLSGETLPAAGSNTVPTRPRRRHAANEEAAEIAEDVPRIEPQTLKWAFFLAALFTVVVLVAFFYLIQTARRINLTPNEAASQQASNSPASKTAEPSAEPVAAPISKNPTLRLYTDLVPGTYSLDDKPPEDLKDGEIILDNLQPGEHSIKVSGRSGMAAFSFDITANSAPHVVGLPTASNAMAVLVSEQDGTGRLITNADNTSVFLDGKPAGEVGTDGLQLTDLGTADHDLQVTQDKDRQRFVMTYTPAPVLTAYVKSDPNAGTVVVKTGQDGASVYINGKLYRRETDQGQMRIPLKVGEYTISVHKPGFIDPPAESVEVKKAEEAAVEFKLDPAPVIATLNVKGALPGTMVYIDKNFAALIGADGNASISNVKPGDHIVELRRDQALPKRFERVFQSGESVVLSGPDVTLDKVVTESKPALPSTPAPQPAPSPLSSASAVHYSLRGLTHGGGLFKHNKLQWYAGFQDSLNYVLFSLDGKHAIIRQVRDGKATEISKVPFSVDSNEWVLIDLSVKPNTINARVKTADGEWTDIGSVISPGRDFTQGKIGVYKSGNDDTQNQ